MTISAKPGHGVQHSTATEPAAQTLATTGTDMTNDEVTKCPYCQKALAAPGARFCTECDQWQDCRGRFLSQMNLGDLALYGSIVVLLFTSFSALAFGKHAKIEATTLNCSDFIATAYVSNSGSTSGIITRAALWAEQGSSIGMATASFIKTDVSSDHRTVAPDAGHLFQLSIVDTDRPALMTGIIMTDSACVIRATLSAIMDSKATLKTIPAKGSCSCVDFVRS